MVVSELMEDVQKMPPAASAARTNTTANNANINTSTNAAARSPLVSVLSL